jgi:hypothetical protein
VITVKSELANYIAASAEGAGIPFRLLGTVAGDSLTIEGLMSIPVSTLRTTHESWFPSYMDTAAAMAAE